jgi:hypothetical protein
MAMADFVRADDGFWAAGGWLHCSFSSSTPRRSAGRQHLFSRAYFGQEMLLESRLEQGNFSQRAVKDDRSGKIPAAVLTRLNCLPFNVDYLAE